MTLTKPKLAIGGAIMSAITLAAFAILPASAMAGEKMAGEKALTPPTTFNVATATDGTIKLGIQSFNRGDYAKSVALHKAAIRSRLSPRKAAVAQSNLCASWAMMDDFVQAEKACDTALKLRPGYGPALANRQLLNVRLAEK